MTSPREEIIEVIKRTYKGYWTIIQAQDEINNDVDKIISIFEKRMDKFIEEERKLNYAEIDEAIAVIEELKKEILK